MTHQEFIEKLKEIKQEFIDEVYYYYRISNRDRGWLAYTRWEERLTALLKEYVPEEASRYAKATSGLFLSSRTGESALDSFLRNHGNRSIAFVEDLIATVEKGRIHLKEDPPSLSDLITPAKTDSILPLIENMESNQIKESLERFRKDHPDPSKVAFVMMRFGSTKAHENIIAGIKKTLAPLGIDAVRADEKDYHDDLFPNVLTYMQGAGFGIAVFERIESEEFNPNVALEVGYMLALQKPVCLLKDKTLKILHADLVGKLYKVFDPLDAIKTIPLQLSKWLEDKELLR